MYLLSPGVLLQTTRRRTGSTPAPPERSGALTLNIRLWSSRRSFSTTCTWPGTGATRWPAFSVWPRDKWRSGSRTGGWKWRSWTGSGVAKTSYEAHEPPPPPPLRLLLLLFSPTRPSAWILGKAVILTSSSLGNSFYTDCISIFFAFSSLCRNLNRNSHSDLYVFSF